MQEVLYFVTLIELVLELLPINKTIVALQTLSLASEHR